MSSIFSKSENNSVDHLLAVEDALSRIDAVHCAHWHQQRIVLAFDKSRVAKLCPANDDRLLWERMFVSRVLNWLLDQNVTPCVTRHYASVDCVPSTAFGRVLWRKLNSELRDLERKESGERTPFTSALSCLSPLEKSKLTMSSPTVSLSSLLTPQNTGSGVVGAGRTTSCDGRPKTKEPSVRLVGFVVERAPGMSLHQWAQQQHSLRQWICVLFQLLYTIDTLRALGIRHNDMHWDNVFVDPAGWKKNMSFRVPTSTDEDAVYTVTQRDPAVRLIDFDKASVVDPTSTSAKNKPTRPLPKEWYVALADNPLLRNSLCTAYGMCNEDPNAKYDAHTVLCFLMRGIEQYSYRVPPPLRAWLSNQAMQSGERLHSTDFEGSGGFLCRLGKPFCSTGRSYLPTDAEQLSTLALLTETDLFASLLAGSPVHIETSIADNVFAHPECKTGHVGRR